MVDMRLDACGAGVDMVVGSQVAFHLRLFQPANFLIVPPSSLIPHLHCCSEKLSYQSTLCYMIIPIRLPGQVPAPNHSLPPVLASIGANETVIVELQGSIETEGDYNGESIATLDMSIPVSWARTAFIISNCTYT